MLLMLGMVAFWLHLFFSPVFLFNGSVYLPHGGEEIDGHYATRQECSLHFIIYVTGLDLYSHPELLKDPATKDKIVAGMKKLHIRDAVCVEEDRVSINP